METSGGLGSSPTPSWPNLQNATNLGLICRSIPKLHHFAEIFIFQHFSASKWPTLTMPGGVQNWTDGWFRTIPTCAMTSGSKCHHPEVRTVFHSGAMSFCVNLQFWPKFGVKVANFDDLWRGEKLNNFMVSDHPRVRHDLRIEMPPTGAWYDFPSRSYIISGKLGTFREFSSIFVNFRHFFVKFSPFEMLITRSFLKLLPLGRYPWHRFVKLVRYLATKFDPPNGKWFKNGVKVGNFGKLAKNTIFAQLRRRFAPSKIDQTTQSRPWLELSRRNVRETGPKSFGPMILVPVRAVWKMSFWPKSPIGFGPLLRGRKFTWPNFFWPRPPRPRSEASITVFATVLPSKLTELWPFCWGNSVFRSYFWPHMGDEHGKKYKTTPTLGPSGLGSGWLIKFYMPT